MTHSPPEYEAWYHTRRGGWIAQQEFALLWRLLAPGSGQTILDVGCGTGYFSRCLAGHGLRVTGIDLDEQALAYARQQPGKPVDYIHGSALRLPFPDNSFNYCCAITSLCFISQPEQALSEMWRVARQGVVLGLLNRHSLLYRQKVNRGSYANARWDSRTGVEGWVKLLEPLPANIQYGYAVFLPNADPLARFLEPLIPARFPRGSFLAMAAHKASADRHTDTP